MRKKSYCFYYLRIHFFSTFYKLLSAYFVRFMPSLHSHSMIQCRYLWVCRKGKEKLPKLIVHVDIIYALQFFTDTSGRKSLRKLVGNGIGWNMHELEKCAYSWLRKNCSKLAMNARKRFLRLWLMDQWVNELNFEIEGWNLATVSEIWSEKKFRTTQMEGEKLVERNFK